VLGRPRAAAYGVGRDKVLRVIEILCHEGIGFSAPQPGTYVCPDAK
jgi:hypothetical protein